MKQQDIDHFLSLHRNCCITFLCSHLLPLAQYFASTMMIVGLSVVVTVLVLQFHHHDPQGGKMPKWVSWQVITRKIKYCNCTVLYSTTVCIKRCICTWLVNKKCRTCSNQHDSTPDLSLKVLLCQVCGNIVFIITSLL